MPKLLYCWRCKMDVPMLDEREWQQIGAPDGNLIQAMKDYQNRHGVSLAIAMEEAPKEILARYKALTAFEETNVNALYHHRSELYGPQCHVCGKPLRTLVARRCVECGARCGSRSSGIYGDEARQGIMNPVSQLTSCCNRRAKVLAVARWSFWRGRRSASHFQLTISSGMRRRPSLRVLPETTRMRATSREQPL